VKERERERERWIGEEWKKLERKSGLLSQADSRRRGTKRSRKQKCTSIFTGYKRPQKLHYV
jgi:hypothetical protein